MLLEKDDIDFINIDYPRDSSDIPDDDPGTILIYWKILGTNKCFGMQINLTDNGIYINFDGKNIQPIKKVKMYGTNIFKKNLEFVIKMSDLIDDLKDAIESHMEIYSVDYDDQIDQLNRKYLNYKPRY